MQQENSDLILPGNAGLSEYRFKLEACRTEKKPLPA